MDQMKAKSILDSVGKEAVECFVGACPEAVALKSKDPAVCWEISRTVHFATVTEFTGPNANDDPDAPLLFRMRVNEYPPPALHYFLRRHRGSPIIAESPVLNLFARAKEIPLLGAWVASWHRSWLRDDASPPEPPVELVAEIVGKDLSEELLDFTALGEAWRNQGYLWTRRARRAFEPWYRGERGS
jgi:hypothetical protein